MEATYGKVLLGKIEAEDYSYTNKTGVFTETTSDEGGGKNVGWIKSSEILTYNVNIPVSGTYKIDFRVAGTSNGVIEFKSGENLLSTVNFPSTGSWQKWQTISTNVTLSAGMQPLTIFVTTPGFNINWINISPVSFKFGEFTISE